MLVGWMLLAGRERKQAMPAEYPGLVPSSHNLRLETLINTRWLAILGQTSAVLVVWLLLEFEFRPVLCLALIAASVMLNIFLSIRYPATTRLSERASTILLAYDMLQLAVLLYLTGGLGNPFSFLLLVPVFISATTLSISSTVLLGVVGLSSATFLAFKFWPLPWSGPEGLLLPLTYIAGMWFAIVSSLMFTAIYAFRVAEEARQLAEALAATELVLQREQHLSSLDGLAAAAAHELGTPLATISLVAKEMLRDFDKKSPMYEDVKLLRSQAQRCRDIMQTLTSLSTEGDSHISIIPFSAMLEEVSQPHRDFGVEINIELSGEGRLPDCLRNSAIIYGLGNLVENAVDHAREKVSLDAGWDNEQVWLKISDDGSGFDEETILRIGEPFLKSRSMIKRGGGLGLGLFIAITLLERNGASVKFSNSQSKEMPGAEIRVVWPRSAIEAKQGSRAS